MQALIDQLKEYYGKATIEEQIYRKKTEIALWKQKILTIVQVTLSSFTTAGFLGTLFDPGKLIALGGTLCSATLLGISSYLRFYNFAKIASNNNQVAIELWIIQEELLSMLADLYDGKLSSDDASKHRDELLKKQARVYKKAALDTTIGDVKVPKRLRERWEVALSKEEINELLPNHLRGDLKQKKSG